MFPSDENHGLTFSRYRQNISVMTETTARKKLPAAVERFVLHWGDMGDEWGVNRSVSQIHWSALSVEAPMTADDIADTLGNGAIQRFNSIRSCCPGIFDPRVPIMEIARSYEAETDIWSGCPNCRRPQGAGDRSGRGGIARLLIDAADDPTISSVRANG